MPNTILIVDDLESNRQILREMLYRDYSILEAENGRDALDMLEREHDAISAVLLDIHMPEMDGYEVLRSIRSSASLSGLPIIMITGDGDETARIQSLTLGADDFVVKPYNSKVIKHCLRNNIAFREAAATVDALKRDALTGLYTREAFFEIVKSTVSANEPGSYIMACFDIDKFKVINDQYGTVGGDNVLKHVANVFREGFEPHGGICCRVFADNFAVLYPTAFCDSEEISEIRKRASQIDGYVAPIIFSIGRYIIDDLSLAPAAMYDRAVLAVNTIKGQYDSKIAFYDEAMRERLIREQEIVMEMDGALKDKQFEVWFQPQYNHSTSAMIGAEALVRWRHPQKGLIPPNDFIPVFEKNGFVYSLDKFVWDGVCGYLRKWLDEGRSPLPVSVNISRYDIIHHDIVDIFSGLIQKYNLPIDLLRLEVTESAFAESPQSIISTISELVKRGFTVEIDDFGSGYSSLNILKNVPAQVIKLDTKFFDSQGDSQRGGNIVESVVRMAKWLGMSIIAEGVETSEQADYLRSIGCNYIQGYLYSRPLPAEQYELHCIGVGKEERLLALETVENLDNNSFWDPESIDTLIFNSYVGGACIYEFCNGKIELLRATEKYAQIIGSAGMTVEDALKLDWSKHLDEENLSRVITDLEESIKTKKEVTGEYLFLNLPNCPHETHLRSTMRVIASAGERYLVYCTNENITERVEAERKIKRLSDQLQSIMDNVDLGIIATIVDNDSAHYLFANNHYYDMLGYTREHFESEIKSPYLTIAPEDRQRIIEETATINRTGKSAALVYRVILADGRNRIFRATVSMAAISGIEEPVQLSIVRDITEETEIAQREKMAAEQIQAIMRDVSSGIAAIVLNDDRRAEILFSNNKYFEIRGYSREQYKNEVFDDPFDIVHPDDRERVRREVLESHSDKQQTEIEYRIICRNGDERFIRCSLSSTRFTGVDRNVYIFIFTDITDAKHAEEKIKETSAQLQSMMSDMPGGFARMRIFDDGRITTIYINDGLLKLTGMSHDEIMEIYSNDALAGVHPDDIQIVNETVEKMMSEGEAHSSRYRLRHSNGDYIWLMIFGRLTLGASGEKYLNIYYTDASEQVKEEALQKELLDNLPYGAALYEFDGNRLSVIHLNKRYWELVNREASKNYRANFINAVHPDDHSIISLEITTAIREKRDISCDIRVLYGENEYRTFHIVGHIVEHKDEKYSIYASYTPISEESISYQQLLPLLLSAIMESTTDLSFVKDKYFRYITASGAFAKMVGLESEKDIIGKTDYDIFSKEMADKFRGDDEELLKNNKSIVDMVESIPSNDGTPHYSSTSKYLLRDGTGDVIGIYGSGRDITKSFAQDSRLQLVNDSIPGGIATYVCTPGSFSAENIKITYFNDGYCKLFGFTHEEYESRASVDPMSMIFAEDHRIIAEQWLSLMKHNTPINCIYRVHVKDGSYKWINHKAVAASRENGRVVTNSILQDVTDQHELIEQLRISEEENHLAVQLGGSVICRYIIDDRSLTMSPEAAKAFDLPEKIADVPYEPIYQGMISPESADAYIGFFEAILHGSKEATAIFQQKYFKGWRWMEAKSSTVFSTDGKPVKAVISFYDVTDRLERETIYKKWQQSLEDRPHESYSLYRCNLNNDAIYATAEGSLLTFDFDNAGRDFNDRAKNYIKQNVFEEDQAKYKAFVNSDSLLAGYYRGKRSGVLEYRELLPGGDYRWLKLTVDLVEYPNSTEVEAYLMYESIDASKRAELQTKALSETDLLTGVLNRTTFAARVNHIIRTSKPGTRHALFMLDIDGFKQVNDVFGHATGDQTLIDVAGNIHSVLRRDDLVGRLGGDEFTVFLNDILDDNSAAVKAKKICALMNKALSMEVQISGSVGIALSPNDGMSFDALYKKADAALYHVKGSGKDNFAFYDESMSDEHLTPELDVDGKQKTEKRRRMLIVDDSSIDYALLQNIFKNEFIIEKARDGASALIRLRHYGNAVSVVLLDLMMPGMDGFSVLEKMQSSADLRTIPVIIVSGDESRESCLKAIRKGATDFITKPVDPELLRIRVSSAVSKAENERLRAQNCLLELRNEERVRYESVLDGTGVTFLEYNWLTGDFNYYPSISNYLAGVYDNRSLWQILLSDMVADTKTVQDMQQLVHRVAEIRTRLSESQIFKLKTPSGAVHSFRMSVKKLTNEYQLTNKLIITLTDLDYGIETEG